jgi:predicted porin
MQKLLISVPVAALLAIPPMAVPLSAFADTTLYGRIRNNLVYRDYGKSDTSTDGQWDVESHSSRFGFKGSEDLGGGLQALFQLEFQVDTSDGVGTSNEGPRTRLGWTGISGGWGTATIGRQWSPYYGSVNKTDRFQMAQMNDYILMGTLATLTGGSSEPISNTTSRIGDMVLYASPEFYGFSGKAALIMASEDDLPNLNNENVDIVNISLDYANGPLSVGISYMGYQGDNDKTGTDFSYFDNDLWGIGAKYDFSDIFSLIAQYQSYDGSDNQQYALMGEYYFGNNTLRAVWARADVDLDQAPDGDYDSYGIEAEHKFSKRTRIYASFYDSDLWSIGTDNNGRTETYDGTKYGMGIRHDF